MDFIIKMKIKMRSPIIRLLQRAISNFNLFEFVMPIISLVIGLGVVNRASIMIDVITQMQMILYLTFLEIGSQVYKFYKKEFLHPFTKTGTPDEKSAALLLVILFFGLSTLPLSQIIQHSRSSSTFLILLAISSFLVIIWRNVEESLIYQILSIFIFSFNNSFLIPVSQLMFNGLNANALFMTITQILFLFLFGYLMIREIFQIEIDLVQSRIVQIIGSIPLLKMAELILILGSVLLVIFSIRNPDVEIIVFASISTGLLLLSLHQTFYLERDGKPGLKSIYRITTFLLIIQYLGWLFILWIP